MSATLPTLFSIQGFMMWNFWSVYMSGELKSASNRRRQLWIMFGALAFDTVLLVIGALLLFHVTGQRLHVRGERVAEQGVRDPAGPSTSSWLRCGRTSRSSPASSWLLPVLVAAVHDSKTNQADPEVDYNQDPYC